MRTDHVVACVCVCVCVFDFTNTWDGEKREGLLCYFVHTSVLSSYFRIG